MGTIKLNGIIISESNLGDYDKMLTMLTPGLGKISCVAKGARRPKSALLAGTQFLCFGEYLMYKGSSTYNINSCEMIEVFYNLRTDLDKLNYAVYITKIIKEVTEENQNCYKILQLFLNTLYTLSETDKDPELILCIFKLKLLCFLGFTPRVSKCTSCDSVENIRYFSIRDNGGKCQICAKQDKSCLEMSESTQSAIKYIVMSPAKKLYSFNLKDESLNELKLITKLFFDEKLEKQYNM
jgi:DNA repair protein RecO (recombination protein O)